MENPYLVCFDTDHIKEYVFATDKLREVRGASKLLVEINEGEMENVIRQVCPDYEPVYFAGGSAAILAPSEEMGQQVVQAIEALYQERTHTASITGICLPLAPATLEAGFGERMALGALRLRAAKDEKARRSAILLEPFMQPCSSCRAYPAALLSPIDESPICEACHAKREAFTRASGAPEDLGQLGDIAHPSGYVGFIYADGNNIGKLLRKMNTKADYEKFAEDLNRLVKQSVDDSLSAYATRQDIQPYEKLLVGGDDLMLVTAGDLALPVAADIARRFEAGSLAILKEQNIQEIERFTLGVGVVLAHASFPMLMFQKLAKQLLGRAKQRCAETRYQTSALDFMVVTAAGSADVSTLREEVLSEKAFVFSHGKRRVRLTQRPYTLVEANKLFAHVGAFKGGGFPRSQLQYLYEGLFHSQVEAIHRWGRVSQRVKEKQRNLMEAFVTDFGSGANPSLPPWRGDVDQQGDKIVTAFGDLVEIYPYIGSYIEA